jgi:Tfp pilus assembly protein PilF/opacity protein-like surface antigen
MEGSVETKADSTIDWSTAKLNTQFCVGDAIRTGTDGRAAIRMINETLLRLDSDSALTFTQVARKERSFLDLLKGAVHFISRTPRSLEIKTPFVNAAIEGTEFVVRVDDTSTDVTVFEGVVVASNTAGSVRLTANQVGRAESGQAPVRIAVARPRDAVTWALYYPPLPEQPGVADSLAQQTVAAIARNQIDEAAALAAQATTADPQSAAAWMAQSYVDQARFDIPAALEHSRKAAELAPGSALTQARLAEVWLMTGDSRRAKQAATEAVALDPNLSLTQSVFGFASLRDVNLDAARAAFEKAIALDTAAPLPRLGLGLVKIRRGDLSGGREDLEAAALLDPNNALLRSYMGKAYYEEKRSELASEQFAMAKDLDPNDPTPWFYDSILLQSENRPVEALQAQQQAIALNDNRAVYRSRQLLDSDNASRDVALGRIYNDLSFEQLARLQSTHALALDPGNHSAHRLLADSYAGITNLDAARQSELLQAKLTQPLNLDPLQPQLTNSNLGLLDGNGPGDLSYNEYNPLFTSNGMALQLDAAVAENNTWSDDAIVAGLFNRFAFSFGQYHTETDGFTTNADFDQDIYNAFAQFDVSENTSLQVEYNRSEEEKGDVTQRLMPELLSILTRTNNQTKSIRVGANTQINNNNSLRFSAIQKDFELKNFQNFGFVTFDYILDNKVNIYDIQYSNTTGENKLLAGLSYNQLKKNNDLFIGDFQPFPTNTDEIEQSRAYLYYFTQPFNFIELTTGLTHQHNNYADDIVDKVYPKIGINIKPHNTHRLRLAAYRTRPSAIYTSLYETLEPTQINGFNQLYDDLERTDAWNYGIGYDVTITNNVYAGIEYIQRKQERLDFGDLEYKEDIVNLWQNIVINDQVSLSANYFYNFYHLTKGFPGATQPLFAPDGVQKLETHKIPLTLNYNHRSGISTNLTTTYYKQRGDFIDRFEIEGSAKTSGWISDLSFNYKFKKRYGSFSIGAKNIFNKHMQIEDRETYDAQESIWFTSPGSFANERLFFGSLSLNFR